jgi:replication factor C small subunit
MKNLIWYENYRAKELDDLVLPRTMRQQCNSFIEKKQIPHLLFHGPAGSGKTSLAMILIKSCASASLVLNASSSDRGIATIKVKVKQFASSQRRHKDRQNIILFDEADGLTPEAQMALKNTIEAYQSNCRFIFTANEFDRITEPIYSRCMLFKFDSMKDRDLYELLKFILEKEEVKYKTKDLESIVDRFKPDIRTIINNLQAASVTGKLKVKDALTFLDLDKFSDLMYDGKLFDLRQMWSGQIDFVWIYKFLFNDFVPDMEDVEIRADAAVTVAEYLHRDRTIADREINMSACCAELMGLLDLEVKL